MLDDKKIAKWNKQSSNMEFTEDGEAYKAAFLGHESTAKENIAGEVPGIHLATPRGVKTQPKRVNAISSEVPIVSLGGNGHAAGQA